MSYVVVPRCRSIISRICRYAAISIGNRKLSPELGTKHTEFIILLDREKKKQNNFPKLLTKCMQCGLTFIIRFLIAMRHLLNAQASSKAVASILGVLAMFRCYTVTAAHICSTNLV